MPHVTHNHTAHNTARWLTAAYTAVIVYATLHPLEALKLSEASPWLFVFKPWSRVGLTAFDLGINVIAYAPLGFGVAWLMAKHWPRLVVVLLAVLMSASLSFLLEATQSYSSLRVASTLDVFSNAVGALLGAVVATTMRGRISLLGRAIQHCISPHRGALWAVVGLWALAQMHPQGWAFMTSPLTPILGRWLPQALAGKPLLGQELQSLETITTAVALTGLLALIRLGLHTRVQSLVRLSMLCGALALAMAWQALAYVMQFGPGQWQLLLSEGVLDAVAPVFALCICLALLPNGFAWVCCVAALALHTALAQILPPHPYTISAPLWQQGRFIHLYGLTAVASALWPVLALMALMLQSRYGTKRISSL